MNMAEGGNTIDIDDQEEFGMIKKDGTIKISDIPGLVAKLMDIDQRLTDIEGWRKGLAEVAKKSVETLDLMLTPEGRINAEKYLDKLRAAKQSDENNL